MCAEVLDCDQPITYCSLYSHTMTIGLCMENKRFKATRYNTSKLQTINEKERYK